MPLNTQDVMPFQGADREHEDSHPERSEEPGELHAADRVEKLVPRHRFYQQGDKHQADAQFDQCSSMHAWLDIRVIEQKKELYNSIILVGMSP